MLYSVKQLQGYTIQASDGDIGSVRTFYFDDESWCIRYLVVDTGNWLPGKRVLLAPIALSEPAPATQHLPVNLTREQVRHSPDVNTDIPGSRQQEIALHAHYNWPAYWTMRDPLVGYAMSARPGGPPDSPPVVPANIPEDLDQRRGDAHLRSMREVMGYHIGASDGLVGHVEDFIIETENWFVRYLVIDTRNWWPGKKVLIAPAWIHEVNWHASQVEVDLSRDQIKGSPAFNPAEPVTRDYERALHDYYGRSVYWT
jgi:hypothetical protein